MASERAEAIFPRNWSAAGISEPGGFRRELGVSEC
jgi:hypothetical protein